MYVNNNNNHDNNNKRKKRKNRKKINNKTKNTYHEKCVFDWFVFIVKIDADRIHILQCR